jgi:high-affinity iron transporter
MFTRMTPTRRRFWISGAGPDCRKVVTAALASVMTVAAAGCAGLGSAGADKIDVTAKACGPGWRGARSGPVTFHVANDTTSTVDVQLLGSGTQWVFAEIPTLGPGTTRPLPVTLGPGRYTWQCASLTGEIYTSDPGRVTGAKVASTPPYIPVNPDDLGAAVDTYRNSVTAGLITLAQDADALRAAVDSGDLPEARSKWLVAHLDYERLGAAYDTFGAFDDEIDGRPNGLPNGVGNPQFTGFLRLEYDLWHHQSRPVLTRVVNQLDRYVHELQVAFPHQLMLATDLPLRAHEILENALQFQLTGESDEGSHTNLATIRANVDGTDMTIDALAPLLSIRYPQLLASVRHGLDHLAAMLDGFHTAGGWTPVESLSTAQRERLDGTMSGLLEQLSDIPGSLRLFSVGAD